MPKFSKLRQERDRKAAKIKTCSFTYPKAAEYHTVGNQLQVTAFQMSANMSSERALDTFLENKPRSFKLHGYRYEQETGVFYAMGEEFQG